jgi:hypothetical protein
VASLSTCDSFIADRDFWLWELKFRRLLSLLKKNLGN